MAIRITVFECDECGKCVGLKTDADWKIFDLTWWEGFKFQFCPTCTEKPETQRRRLEDSRMLSASVKKIMIANLSEAQ